MGLNWLGMSVPMAGTEEVQSLEQIIITVYGVLGHFGTGCALAMF